MKTSILAGLATLLACSNAYSDDMLFSLKSRPSELGMDILAPKQDPWYTAPYVNIEVEQELRYIQMKGLGRS